MGTAIALALQVSGERLAIAARRIGRDPGEISIVAVSKGVEAQRIRQAYAAGIRLVGESRVQESIAKAEQLKDLDLEWHLVGHLQTNKVSQAVGHFALIHSVDSVRLLQAIAREAKRKGLRQRILLQVNLAQEAGKHGFALQEVAAATSEAANFANIALEGFMILAPYDPDPEKARPVFRSLKELRDRLAPALSTLSMGMTHDAQIAVEEGATLVRIGTGIFGQRT
ncbi:MAG: YggS family pyridoxal phosphate-dependent enzyme [Cyanobacteria bacterium NC_groundwater_1444_Ag_S-0.65um_54_12]|nr:YggS family pyridoxal phosphate-dependent enzyme [Cyanobacteria bacterium NC_groundwater_1444_Ag_S-0.65um_54_12]